MISLYNYQFLTISASLSRPNESSSVRNSNVEASGLSGLHSQLLWKWKNTVLCFLFWRRAWSYEANGSSCLNLKDTWSGYFEEGAQQIPYQHHLCMSKDMRNTSRHEGTGLPATTARLDWIRVSDSLKIPLFSSSEVKHFSVSAGEMQTWTLSLHNRQF